MVEESGKALLGKETATKLGILNICIPTQCVNSVSIEFDENTLITKYADVFQGIGKLKSFQLHVPIDESVEPVIQPVRRVPYHLREKLEKRLSDLVRDDIIEKVNEPSKWISPVVIVPKPNGDIRLCIDM